jgi:hypothetical protein
MLAMLHIGFSLIVAGCGDDTVAPGIDGGTDGGADAAAGDAGDVDPPSVIASVPRDGEVDVDPSRSIRVVFSEAVAPSATLELRANGASVATASSEWSEDGRELTIVPEALPTNSAVQAIVSDVVDLAGNTMASEFELGFTTSDRVAPSVIRASPAEGATADPSIEEIEIEFSEIMNAAIGAALLEGGPGALGEPRWEGARATFPVSGLAPDTNYRVELLGFADPAGNAVAGASYLGDGALDFRTGGDAIAPFVIEAVPGEASSAVPPNRTTRVRIAFSEPMDPDAGSVALAGTTTVELSRSWTAGGTILLLDVSGLLESDTGYRVTLAGFADLAGNALDGAPVLGDGALDFRTGEDELPPFVLFSNPPEGATGVHWSTRTLFVTFSEPMNTSTRDLSVEDGIASSSFAGTWSSGGTLLSIDVAGRLVSGRHYTIDFTAIRDEDGLPLDASHAYLGDGRLSFDTVSPRGENCQDFLTSDQATTTEEGHLEWTIENTQVENADGAAPCDASGGSPDAVIRYRKSSPPSSDPSGAGRVLRITASTTSTVSPALNVDVLRDACDPTSAAASTARLACRTNAHPQVLELDVPAGDYFVWVASSSTLFRGATVRIEEVPAVPGDTCASALPITAGTTPITPTGTLSLNAPSCIAAPITWYRYSARENAAFVTTDTGGAIAVVDASTGREAGCGDAFGAPLGAAVHAGETVCVAVTSGAIGAITVEEVPYTGVRGDVTHLGIAAPACSSFGLVPTFGWMVADDSTLYGGVGIVSTSCGSGSAVATMPKTGAAAIALSPVPGTQMGSDALVHAGAIFSLDNSGIGSERLHRFVPVAGGGFTTMPWDTGSSYTGALEAMAFDGTRFVLANYASAAGTLPTVFYALDATSPGVATSVGSNDTLREVSGIAADATWIYAVATVGGDEGLFRLRRSELGDPAAAPEVLYLDDMSDRNAALMLDDVASPAILYFRTYDGPNKVFALLNPRSASPRLLGPLTNLGRTGDNAMALDPSGSLFLFESTTTTAGNFVRID